jgi:hypothetical protein
MALAAFIAAACIYLFFLDPWGHDTWFHLQRLQDIRAQLADGRLYAHFAENAAQGKGIAVWVYYSQWVYWPAALLAGLGVTPLVALKVVYSLFLAVTAHGCYRLLRIEVDPEWASLGSLLFVTSNYVIGEVFQRSAYAEFLSVALLPHLLVAVHGVTQDAGRRHAPALAIFAALMVLFHPLSFMNAGIALAVYALFDAMQRGTPYGQLLRLLPPLALALGVTAFYWAPAVIETRYVLGGEGVPTPLRDTFLSLWSYVNPTSITTPGFSLGLLAFLVLASLLARRRAPDTPPISRSWPLLAGIAAYFLLTLRPTEPLYEHVPLLASNLWVWRVLYPMILLTVVFVFANLAALPERLRNGAAQQLIAGVAVLQAVTLVVWNTWADLSLLPMDTRTIERNVGVESQRTGGFGIDEYLPQLREVPRHDAPCRSPRTIAPDGRYEMSFPVARDDAHACIRIPRYWNTRYEATIDGSPARVYGNAAGEMVLVPSGREGVARIWYGRPKYVTVAWIVSAVSAILLVFSFAIGTGRRTATARR